MVMAAPTMRKLKAVMTALRIELKIKKPLRIYPKWLIYRLLKLDSNQRPSD